MTRILFACLLLIATASSLAQTFACQYIESGGLIWESGAWVASRFKISEPFFFTIKADVGITSFKGDALIEMVPPTCYQKAGKHWCSNPVGLFLYFWESTQRGAISRSFGAVQNGDKRDGLAISPFICTKM